MDNTKYNQLYKYLSTLTFDLDISNTEKSRIQKEAKNYLVENNILYKRNKHKPQRVIKIDQKHIILYTLHDEQGVHLGIQSTYNKIKERYYWPTMYKDIEEYIKTCDICQRRGHEVQRQNLQPLEVKYPFYRVGIDIKGPLPPSKHGNRYIIVAMDYLTKWPEAKAVSDIKATTVAKFIYEDIICRHGTPTILLSDRGKNFLSEIVKELCTNFQIKHHKSSAYRPQTNGMIERFNRTIGEALAKITSYKYKEWDEILPSVLLAYRTMKHNTTKFTPFSLIYGRDAKLPIESIIETYYEENNSFQEALLKRIFEIEDVLLKQQEEAINNIREVQKLQKEYHDKNLRHSKLNIGDQVLVAKSFLKNVFSAKLEEKFMGPYIICDILDLGVYKLKTLDNKKVKDPVHSDRLKLYHSRKLEDLPVLQVIITQNSTQ
jgi:hypothetical protein